MVFLCMALLAGCGMAQGRAEQTPEDALREMQRAVAQRDREQLSRYVDLEDFLGRTYDEAGHQTAVRIGELGKRYPKDPFFWHDTAFMENYAREHREISMEFMRQILSHYFSGKEPASSYDENPTSWLSGELGRLYRASQAEVTEIRQDGKKAVDCICRRAVRRIQLPNPVKSPVDNAVSVYEHEFHRGFSLFCFSAQADNFITELCCDLVFQHLCRLAHFLLKVVDECLSLCHGHFDSIGLGSGIHRC